MDNNTDVVKKVMEDLSNKVNPTSSKEGVKKLKEALEAKDPSNLLKSMSEGAKEFEERTGEPLPYWKMRDMWG